MGYAPGQGLGKNLQGINKPVEAFLRRGRAAVGAYGSEAPKQNLRTTEADVEGGEVKEQMKKWKKKDGDGSKKKVKYILKTADELLREPPSKHKMRPGLDAGPQTKVKVIDMTGREQRVLSGYHAIAHKHDMPEEDAEEAATSAAQVRAFDMPELLHNLDLLVDMAEEAIIKNDRRVKFESDNIINLGVYIYHAFV